MTKNEQRKNIKKGKEKCELCDEFEDEIYICKICGTKFCDDCGDSEKIICINCLDDEDENTYEYYIEESIPDWSKEKQTPGYKFSIEK